MGLWCDFCQSTDVHWSFPARSFEVKYPAGASPAVRSESVGDWAACTVCHALIIRGDRIKLARRGAKKFVKREPQLPLNKTTNYMRQIHDQFWANRLGDPVKIDP
jgi:hypothetical protein